MAHKSNQKVTTGTAVRIMSDKLEMLNSNIEKCVRQCKEQGCPLECNTVKDKGQWYPLEQHNNDKGAALMSNRTEVNTTPRSVLHWTRSLYPMECLHMLHNSLCAS